MHGEELHQLIESCSSRCEEQGGCNGWQLGGGVLLDGGGAGGWGSQMGRDHITLDANRMGVSVQCVCVCVCVCVFKASVGKTAYLCNLPQPLGTRLPKLLLLFLVINGPATPKDSAQDACDKEGT